jgi:hypothetical protein
MNAQYLLRFDDLCPTMDRARWERFVPMLDRYGIMPLLAVVPKNCDPELVRDEVDADFWERMRSMEAAGATIGLHGYRHVCEATGRSLIPLHRQSEFAGVSEDRQREWIRAGMGILRGHGLNPKVWVAPRHGLDRATLRALREEGIDTVSDGFARRPFRWDGMKWIPAQIWGPVEKAWGLWTICLHSNSATDEDVRELQRFLECRADRFTSVDRVLGEGSFAERSMADRLFHAEIMARLGWTRLRRRFLG